jgi:integrase
MILTPKTLANLAEGAKASDDGFDPDGLLKGKLKGSLVARRRSGRNNVEFYLRMRAAGMDKMHRIGTWSPNSAPGCVTLSEARHQAMQLAMHYADEGADFKAQREAEKEAERQAQEAAEAMRNQQAAEARGENSLGALLIAYTEDMQKRGRSSHRDVERMFRSRIEKLHPDLWAKPAHQVRKDDLLAVLGGMASEGIERRVNMMRSCLKTAYEFGLGMEDDIHHHEKAKIFNLSDNPAARIKRRAEFDKANDRVLTPIEVGAYLRELEKVDSLPVKIFLKLHIRLGGQRVEQLLRAKWSDIREGTLQLIDAKGRGDPRPHLLPLSDTAKELIKELAGLSPEWLFSTTGKVAMRPETATSAVREIAARLVQEEIASATFSPSDLRRTAETLMASIGVDKDTRTELLSHGRNSLVSRHYDKYEYLPAKRAALAKWNKALDGWMKGDTGKVVGIRTKKA